MNRLDLKSENINSIISFHSICISFHLLFSAFPSALLLPFLIFFIIFNTVKFPSAKEVLVLGVAYFELIHGTL
jgi:hypothetical protein